MPRLRTLSVFGLLVVLLVTSLAPGAMAAPRAIAAPSALPAGMGTLAYAYTQALASGARVASTPAELAAAHTVAGWFEDAGYEPTIQPFVYGPASKRSASQNVIAFKPAVSPSAGHAVPLVIVGAHYDCVRAGKGADDNASGVGVMLELAARLADEPLPYDLVFIAFGAEEVGLEGSDYYVRQMSKADTDRAIAMINFDSLIVGDYRYIHAGFNHQTWARDEILSVVEEYDLGIRMHTAPRYAEGITPPGFSDYTAFSKAGIPVAAFEATNWEIGSLDGYLQLDATQFDDPAYADLWEIWHTPYDTLDFIDGLLGDRPERHLEAFTTAVYVFLRDLTP
jgi:hypothetical protein